MTGQDGRFGTDAVACAFHVTTLPDSVPFAVPDTRRSPAHVALNVPLAVFPVCCVTFQRKSVHVLAVAASVDEVQFPSSAATPVAVGLNVLFRSYPMQAEAAAARATAHVIENRFFRITNLSDATAAMSTPRTNRRE